MSPATLRPARATDAEFLYQVYASTRLAEMASLDWQPAQVQAFLRMQFMAQDNHYRAHFPTARFDVVELRAVPVGRLYVERGDMEIRVLDISLLPQWQHQGTGSALLTMLLDEARATARSVQLHVERHNPALGLYLRLGFVSFDESGVYLAMRWQPVSAAQEDQQAKQAIVAA